MSALRETERARERELVLLLYALFCPLVEIPLNLFIHCFIQQKGSVSYHQVLLQV